MTFGTTPRSETLRMKKLFNRVTAILSLPGALFFLGISKLGKNEKSKKFHSTFLAFNLHAIKTGKFEEPKVFMKRKVYP